MPNWKNMKTFYVAQHIPTGKLLKFGLLKCFFGSNICISDCLAMTKTEAILILRHLNPTVVLDDNGYVKVGDVTYTVAEFFKA